MTPVAFPLDGVQMFAISVRRTSGIGISGIGMSPETLKSIFAPFYTTKPAGTGLGLSIVHRILEAYDCRLEVESEPGRGSTFSLRLKQIEAPLRCAG